VKAANHWDRARAAAFAGLPGISRVHDSYLEVITPLGAVGHAIRPVRVIPVDSKRTLHGREGLLASRR
jgi:hypothetical protein